MLEVVKLGDKRANEPFKHTGGGRKDLLGAVITAPTSRGGVINGYGKSVTMAIFQFFLTFRVIFIAILYSK